MKRIGIMTWFNYYNYGTALQVTALNKKIKDIGYTPEVINYIPHEKLITINEEIFKEYSMKIKKRIKNRNKKEYLNEQRTENFREFLSQNIVLSRRCQVKSSLFELNEEYDAFICGSDQIWAPTIFNPRYFLDFVKENRKKIAYAPSIGLSKVDDIFVKKEMTNLIADFGSISIREEQGKKIIKELTGREAKVVLDPTLLLDSTEWDEIGQVTKKDEKYVLCYFLGQNEYYWKSVVEIATKLKLKVKIIPVFEKDKSRGFEHIDGVGPKEFLNLISNASVVCTDSFHGTVFSINYNRPFYTYERFSAKDKNSQNSRIYNILNMLNLENRLVKERQNIVYSLECDFEKANKVLKLKRKESIFYLEEALKKAQVKIEEKFEITNTCCGCGACTGVCGKEAIKIEKNNIGFWEATIDQEKCVKCKLCKKVCPYTSNNKEKIKSKKNKLFMYKSNEVEVLRKSSSGGIAMDLSKYLNKKGQNIIGCSYNIENRIAEHLIVRENNEKELEKFQGSKYIQSKLGEECIEEIIKLDGGVFIGTPCQVAGMHNLLQQKKIRQKYILIDLICHGVPTYKLWDKYIEETCKKEEITKIESVKFRAESYPWRDRHLEIKGKNEKKYYGNEKKDKFYKIFKLRNCMLEACYECGYRENSMADLRIGDYWGEKYISDNTGVSMVIALTEVGGQLVNELAVKNIGIIKEDKLNDYWDIQYPYNPIKPVFYNELIKDLDEKTLNEIEEKYCESFRKRESIYKLIYKIKPLIKKVIK
ncbi:MAG: polysaccharide pyruvyl transferase family protein [Clostridium sp.]|uniref:polysaccharide pyruvyl transferase family protein n=1 Tax=Clostridium sp. TaxID=1506 RepID=UPI003F307904